MERANKGVSIDPPKLNGRDACYRNRIVMVSGRVRMVVVLGRVSKPTPIWIGTGSLTILWFIFLRAHNVWVLLEH